MKFTLSTVEGFEMANDREIEFHTLCCLVEMTSKKSCAVLMVLSPSCHISSQPKKRFCIHQQEFFFNSVFEIEPIKAL